MSSFLPDSDAAAAAPAGPGDRSGPAYLIVRSGGRWSEVYRLCPPREAVIGRSSANQIALRSDQASRRHARVTWDGQRWRAEDLGSRNGTFVNGQRLQSARALCDGDVIEVAGFGITFALQIDSDSVADDPSGEAPDQATDDQITMEIGSDSITERCRRSRYLHQSPETGRDPGRGASAPLLQLAFSLAGADTVRGSAEIVLEAITRQCQRGAAGLYVWPPSSPPPPIDQAPLVATRQPDAGSYRRVPQSLGSLITGERSEAILAHNLPADPPLASDAQHGNGGGDGQSLILAPVRDTAGQLRGAIHVSTTAADAPPLNKDDLEFVAAAAEIWAESLSKLADRDQLNRSLRHSRRRVAQLQQQLNSRVRIIGHSSAAEQVGEQIALAAPTSATVLVRGESGVGKELVAAAIHHASGRRDGPLVCLNCAALSPSLLESELFGHEKGAFTGATERKPGKFEAADGGTLMLDEIGEMNSDIQAKFLRVLEGHPFERVGGHQPVHADVRVVAATNRDLSAMIREGKFRQDLYYRLNVVEIVVPPLRERGQDVLLLAEYFLKRFNREMGRRIEGLTGAAKRRLLDHRWPGNVRELKNVIERAVVLNTKDVIDASDLALAPPDSAPPASAPPASAPPASAPPASAPPASAGANADSAAVEPEAPVGLSLAELERRHIERVLRHTGGNKSRASAILGIERSTLDRKLKRFAAEP